VAICFAMLWQFPEGQSEMFYFWYFLIGSFIFFLAYTVFATPWVALGYELTPDYNQRNLLMGTQNFIAQLAYLIPPSLLWMVQQSQCSTTWCMAPAWSRSASPCWWW
jgi:GPH family glycoside/pentoside/hexuronide:cation symporter